MSEDNPDILQSVAKDGSGKNRSRWRKEHRKGRGKETKKAKKAKDRIPPPDGEGSA